MRFVWMGLGFLSLGLAILGVFLPILPTTPFILLAAACFARGSVRWHTWLREHPRFGGLLRDWEEHRAIARRTKRIAIAMVVGVGGASVAVIPRWEGRAALAALLLGVIAYIATRPDPPAEDPSTRSARSADRMSADDPPRSEGSSPQG